MKIYIDAGHGFSVDGGAQGNGLREQDITFEVAQRVANALKAVGIETKQSRLKITDNLGTNLSSSLYTRYNDANTWGADLFISIHCNAFSNTTAKGAEVLYHPNSAKGAEFAKKVQPELVKLGLVDRGVKTRSDLAVLNKTNMPAILVECGFITNVDDAKVLKNNQNGLAAAIVNGVLALIGGKTVEAKPEVAPIEQWFGVTATELNVRTSPSTGGKIIATLKKGDQTLAVGKSGDWYEIKIYDGSKAFVHGAYLKPMADSTECTQIDGAQVVAVDPMALRCAVINSSKIPFENGVNSVYFMAQANGIPYPQGIMVSEGKILSNTQPRGRACGTIIVYRDGSACCKPVLDITSESNVWFAVSGCSILPLLKMEDEGFTGVYSDIVRATERPVMGYNPAENKVYIVVAKDCSITKGQELLKGLGCTFGITLDGGGSTKLRVGGRDYFTSSRVVPGVVCW